jgi:hypothetical protein
VREKSLLGFLAVLVVLLLGVFGWLVFRLNSTAKTTAIINAVVANPTAPFFPVGTETSLDTDGAWQRKSFQPIYEDFIEARMGGYLKVSYVASPEGTIKEGKVYLRRLISYVDETNKAVIIDGVKLKDLLKKGDQFGVEYLSQTPKDFSLVTSHCQDTKTQSIECVLAYLKQRSDINKENIFYPFFIYRNLRH